MVASRADTSNPARIPALGIRLAALLILSIVLMVLDHRQNHLQAVRQAIGAGRLAEFTASLRSRYAK